MRWRTLMVLCVECVGYVSLYGVPAKAAELPSLTIDSAAIVPEIRSGDERKGAWFGCVLVEFRGHLKVPNAPREFDFMPSFQPPLQLPPLDERHVHDAWGIGVGVVDNEGNVNYPCLTRRSEKETFSATLPGGAGIEVRYAGGGNRQLKVLSADTPIALAFYLPANKPELKLTLQVMVDRMTVQAPLPGINIASKDLGWPIPDKKQKEAKIAFAVKLPFFIWTETLAVQAMDDYLRFAVNPALPLEDVPELKDIATQAEMIVSQRSGANAHPMMVSADERFGMFLSPNEYQGRGKATVTIVKRRDGPFHADKAPALSNRLNLQMSFDPPKPAKAPTQRSTKSR